MGNAKNEAVPTWSEEVKGDKHPVMHQGRDDSCIVEDGVGELSNSTAKMATTVQGRVSVHLQQEAYKGSLSHPKSRKKIPTTKPLS